MPRFIDTLLVVAIANALALVPRFAVAEVTDVAAPKPNIVFILADDK